MEISALIRISSRAARQRGAATLAVGLIILVLATIVTLFAAKVGLREQQTSGNELRAKQAFETAEAGMEFGQMYLQENVRQINGWVWTTCADARPGWDGRLDPLCQDAAGNNRNDLIWATLPNANLEPPSDAFRAYRTFYLTPDDDGDGLPAALDELQVTIVSEGASDIPDGVFANGTGYASVSVDVDMFPAMAGVPRVPLMASGNIGGTGTFDVVVNPDAGGEGVPISAWSSGDTDLSNIGSAKTCMPHEYFFTGSPYIYNPANPTDTSQTYTYGEATDDVVLCDNCSCPADDSLTLKDGGTTIEGIDIVDIDGGFGDTPDATNFPDDVFEYIFGVDEANWEEVKSWAEVLSGCGGLDNTSSGLYWIEGDCSITQEVGSPTNPVLLVVEGNTQIQGGERTFGLVFAWEDPTKPGTGGDVQLRGGTRFYGAIVSDHLIDMGNGTYQQIYNEQVLANLNRNIGRLGKVPGSWADYQ